MKQGFYLAFVYVGLVIGAGFASGREIMEYFNLPSGLDYSGVVLATFLLIAVCYMVLRRAYLWELRTCDDYLKEVAGPAAKSIKLFMLIYLFCGFFTMFSGSGALLAQSFMLPPLIGILLMAALCFLVLAFDLRGIVTFNMVLVPCMIAGILYVCISGVIFGSQSAFSFHGMTRGMLTSALCYVSYNTVSAPSVLVPLQRGIARGGITVAAVTGGLVLGLLILVIWAVQELHMDALWDSSLPMLKLAAMTGRQQKYLYTAILMMAISTTAVSQGFGLLECFSIQNRRQRMTWAGILCLGAIPFSMLGFSNLVAHLYSFFGITGLIWMGWMVWDFYRSDFKKSIRRHRQE